jgi:hypothetical protein
MAGPIVPDTLTTAKRTGAYCDASKVLAVKAADGHTADATAGRQARI